MIQMKLTVDQTEELPFPIGCPVWYNFPEQTPSIETEEMPILKQGVVESVSFNYGAKDLVYGIMFKDNGGGITITDEVSENQLAYSAGCPVTIDLIGDGLKIEGNILLSEQSPSDHTKFLYTALIPMEGFQARYEMGIDGERIKYRKVKTDLTQIDAPAAISIQKEQQEDTTKHDRSDTASASVPPETKVPSSITCDSAAKKSSKGEGGSSSLKQQRSPDVASQSTGNSRKKLRVDTAQPSHQANNNPHPSHHANNNPDSGRSMTSSNYSSPQNKSHNVGVGHITEKTIEIPQWIQRSYQDKRNLFSHLIGSKRHGFKGNKTVNDIGREVNAHLKVNFTDDEQARTPITITVGAHSKEASALRTWQLALGQTLELMLSFMDIRNDGSKGRLVHDIAASCRGSHRPNNSTSNAVNIRNPFDNGRFAFVAIIELPLEVIREFRHERREFHAKYLLNSKLLDKIRSERCSIKLCGDDFDVPTRYCDPYVFVSGGKWHQVDQTAQMVKDAIRWHMDKCSCGYH